MARAFCRRVCQEEQRGRGAFDEQVGGKAAFALTTAKTYYAQYKWIHLRTIAYGMVGLLVQFRLRPYLASLSRFLLAAALLGVLGHPADPATTGPLVRSTVTKFARLLSAQMKVNIAID